ncbi:MAG: PASTA domain-containing protein, partial [Clostridia bacterium]|nr:PASTA domain-containing protein [Clostridia bacterium]
RYESATEMLADIKRAYTDPDSTVSVPVEDDTDKFGTKKITPIVSITMPNDTSSKSVVRRSDEERIKKKKSKKKDIIAIVAAIVTCFVIACVMGVVVANVIRNNTENQVQIYHMPNVKGLTETQMTNSLKELREAGFEIEENYRVDSNIPKGEVIDQEPIMGDIEEGTKIIITISSGKEKINLDDYTNHDANEAITMLEDMGIVVKTSEEMSDEIDEGKVIRQLPTAGHVLETGDSIRLFVSSGPNKFSLDNYVGAESRNAKSELEAQGITVTVVEEYSDTVPAGVVINQSPAPSTEMKKGDSVEIKVSKGPEMMTVPNLVGLTVDAANDALKNNNLKLGDITEISSGLAKGLVVKQGVAADTQVTKNTVVKIWISKGQEPLSVPDNLTGGVVSPDANIGESQGNAAVNTSDTGL